MDTEILLFILRMISAALLLSILGAVFYIIWKDYRSTIQQIEANRRTYGKLIVMHYAENEYLLTGETYPLLPLTSLGRAPTNTIQIDDSFASSEHARVFLKNGHWWLEDRRSRNGTTLNEVPIHETVIITNGDIIGIGNKRFKLELE
ncbi:MAG: FHA domain-containing protein [Chloroflexi bacterium]|nr:MAG: FHA domain-containing protein [Chloroflexota bacterium]